MSSNKSPYVIGLSGSPVIGSSTEILIREMLRGAESAGAASHYIFLNELEIMPCQACGQSPENGYCFFNDGMDIIYNEFDLCDAMVVGSPIYFDSVSAQTKLFIDRTNCFRSLNREGPDKFIPRIKKRRAGAMVLVGGEREEYEAARRVIGGFFIWANIRSIGAVRFAYDGFEKGTVINHTDLMDMAFRLGQRLVSKK